MTVGKVKEISSSEYARRRDEIFFRLSKRQLSELYGEYEADEYATTAHHFQIINTIPNLSRIPWLFVTSPGTRVLPTQLAGTTVHQKL